MSNKIGSDVENALGEVFAHVRGETALPCRIVDDPAAALRLAKVYVPEDSWINEDLDKALAKLEGDEK